VLELKLLNQATDFNSTRPSVNQELNGLWMDEQKAGELSTKFTSCRCPTAFVYSRCDFASRQFFTHERVASHAVKCRLNVWHRLIQDVCNCINMNGINANGEMAEWLKAMVC